MKRMDLVSPYEQEMLENLKKLIDINSVEGQPLPGKPFGEGPAAALMQALTIGDRLGFETHNMENYCGYAQMGEGKDLIGICAHLDVVPAGEILPFAHLGIATVVFHVMGLKTQAISNGESLL